MNTSGTISGMPTSVSLLVTKPNTTGTSRDCLLVNSPTVGRFITAVDNVQTVTLSMHLLPLSPIGEITLLLMTHLLPDLDGEIYLKTRNPADVNGDWVVNILDSGAGRQ